MTDEPSMDILRAMRNMSPQAEVYVQAQLEGSQNRHAVVRFPDRSPWFVKFYAEAGRYEVEQIVLGELGKKFPWPIPPIAGSREPIAWQAFPFVDLTTVTPSLSVMREWGALLADVHSCTVPAGIPTSSRAVDVLDERLARLDDYDLPFVHESAALAKRVWKKAAGSIGRAAAVHHELPRLLTNDFGFRNTYRVPSGRMILIDFERSVGGDPHWDLGKAWDRELSNPEWAAAFLAAYHESLPGSQDWPHAPTLWVTRLAAALAAIPYALRVGDKPFMLEAFAVMQRLETEIP